MDSTGNFAIFKAEFWGSINLGMFAAAFVMALIGIAFRRLVFTTQRDPLSARTPTHFDWHFFWNDNIKQMLKSTAASLIALFISIRFSEELMGQKLTMFYAFGVGLGLDKMIGKLKRKKDEEI